MTKCSHCGKENLDEAEFCQNCGKRVKDPFFRVPNNIKTQENIKTQSSRFDYKLAIALAVIILVIIVAFILLNIPKSQPNVINSPTLANDTYNNGIVSFNYPKNWVTLPNQTQNTVIALGDANSKNNSSYTTYIAVFKEQQPSGQNLKNTFEATYNKIKMDDSSYQAISNRTVTVNGKTAYEITYQKNVNSQLKKEKSVWVEKNSIIYIITLSSNPNDFEGNINNFNLVVGSFNIN
jgi:hypothetical protein